MAGEWARAEARTWRRSLHPLTVLFGAPMPLSDRRWMILVGARIACTRPRQSPDWLAAIATAWQYVRYEFPAVGIRYDDAMTSSSYTVPTTDDAKVWACETVSIHPRVDDPLGLLSRGAFYPANGHLASIVVFGAEESDAVDVYLQICHGFATAYSSFRLLDALLRNIAVSSHDPIEWGDEVTRLPRLASEQLGFDAQGYELSATAKRHVEWVEQHHQSAIGMPPVPFAPHTLAADRSLTEVHHLVRTLDAQQTAALKQAFARHGMKLGDGLIHLSVLAVYLAAMEFAAKPIPPDALITMTLPMGFDSYVQDKMFAVGGAILLFRASDLAPAAASFDEASPQLSLYVPPLHGVVQRIKASLVSIEAYQAVAPTIDRTMGSLSHEHQRAVLSISVLGEIDGDDGISADYGSGDDMLHVSRPMLGDITVGPPVSLRAWTFRKELTLRFVVHSHAHPASYNDAFSEEYMHMIQRLLAET